MAGPITISVIGDTRSLTGGLDTAGRGLTNLGGKAGRAGKAIAKGLAVGVAGLAVATTAFLGSSLKSLVRIERIGAATDTVIKSTGGIANVTRAHVDELAGTLENLTATEAESITEGANMLLTFTNIRNGAGKTNKIFDQAVGTITDMSRALDKTGGANLDTSKTAIQLGKALNDPIKGVTALSKVGVSFDEQQRAQIKTLQESGDVMGAQKIILGELKKEFGGAGEAFGKSTAGQIELAQHALGTLGESLAAQLLPVLGNLATQATKGLAWLDTQAPAIRAFAGDVLSKLKPGLAVAGDLLTKLGGAALDLAPHLLELGRNVAEYLGPALASFVPYLRDVADAFTTKIIPAATTLGQTLKTNLGPVFADVGDLILDLLPTLQSIGLYIYREVIPAALGLVGTLSGYLAPVLAAVVDIARALGLVFVRDVLPAVQSAAAYFQANVVPILSAVAGVIVNNLLPVAKGLALFLINDLVPVVVAVATKVGAKLKPILDQLAVTFRTSILPAVVKIIAKFEQWRPAIQRAIVVIAKMVGKVLEFAGAILGKVLPPLIRFVGFIIANVVPAVLAYIGVLGKIIGKAIAFGKAIVDTVKDVAKWVTGVRDKIGEAMSVIAGIPGRVTNAVGDLGSLLKDAGIKVIQGFIDGIDSMFDSVKGKLGDLTGKLTSWKGPPKKDATILRGAGRLIIQGLINGFGDQYGAVKKRLGSLTNLIGDYFDKKGGAKAKKAGAAVVAAITAEVNKLNKLAGAYQAAKKAREAYVANIKANAITFADITGLGQVGENGEQSAESIVQGLKDRLNAIRNFNAKIKALAKLGLSKDLLQQIISKGVDGGTATAEALVAGGAATIKAANGIQADIRAAAGALGTSTADAVLKPLDPDKVRRAATNAANTIAAILNKRLGLRIEVIAPATRNAARGADKTKVDPYRPPTRTRVSEEAMRNATAPVLRAKVELTAEQISSIERGRRVTADLKAYKRAGGK